MIRCFFLLVINRAPGLKLVVETLLSSLKSIGNIMVICFVVFIIFAILGVQVCQRMRDENEDECVGLIVIQRKVLLL